MRRTLAPLLVLALLVVGTAACGGDGSDDAKASTTTAAQTTTSAADTDTSTTAAGGHDHGGGIETEGTKVLQYWVRGDKLAVGANGVDAGTTAIGTGALERLLEGPARADALSGMTTLIPEGTELLGLDISDGTATVDLSSTFVSGGGSMSMTLRVAQVVFTITQFPTVERVVFHIDGAEPEGLGGEGLPTSYDGRSGFDDVTPAIVIESPTPYQNVSSPLTISGMANTFEAVVNWWVSSTEGSLLKEGTTTATAGSGTWGTFEVETELPAYQGNVVVTVWEQSGETGSDRTNVYEVLVNLT